MGAVEVTGRSDLGTTGYEEIVGRLFLRDRSEVARQCHHRRYRARTGEFGGSGRFPPRPAYPENRRRPRRENGAAWIEIPNRGQGEPERVVCQARLHRCECGLGIRRAKGENKLRIEVPEAREVDGSPIRGVVRAVFTPTRPRRADRDRSRGVSRRRSEGPRAGSQRSSSEPSRPFPEATRCRANRWAQLHGPIVSASRAASSRRKPTSLLARGGASGGGTRIRGDPRRGVVAEAR